jgi:hypothetical protein
METREKSLAWNESETSAEKVERESEREKKEREKRKTNSQNDPPLHQPEPAQAQATY